MNCSKFRKYHEDFLDPGQDRILYNKLLNHMESCSSCSKYHGNMEKVTIMLKKLRFPSPPPFLETRILAIVKEETGKTSTRVSFTWKKLFTVGIITGIFLVSISLSAYYYWYNQNNYLPPLDKDLLTGALDNPSYSLYSDEAPYTWYIGTSADSETKKSGQNLTSREKYSKRISPTAGNSSIERFVVIPRLTTSKQARIVELFTFIPRKPLTSKQPAKIQERIVQ